MDNKANYNWQCMNYTLYLLLPTTIILLSSNSIELYTNTKNTSILFIEHKHTPNNLFYFFSLLVFVYPLFWLGFYYTFFSIEKSSGPISLYNEQLTKYTNIFRHRVDICIFGVILALFWALWKPFPPPVSPDYNVEKRGQESFLSSENNIVIWGVWGDGNHDGHLHFSGSLVLTTNVRNRWAPIFVPPISMGNTKKPHGHIECRCILSSAQY